MVGVESKHLRTQRIFDMVSHAGREILDREAMSWLRLKGLKGFGQGLQGLQWLQWQPGDGSRAVFA